MAREGKPQVSRFKSKFGKPLGIHTPDQLKGKTISGKVATGAKFNPGLFKTQHKG